MVGRDPVNFQRSASLRYFHLPLLPGTGSISPALSKGTVMSGLSHVTLAFLVGIKGMVGESPPYHKPLGR